MKVWPRALNTPVRDPAVESGGHDVRKRVNRDADRIVRGERRRDIILHQVVHLNEGVGQSIDSRLPVRRYTSVWAFPWVVVV